MRKRKKSHGDFITTINRIVTELKVGGLDKEKEAVNIKILVHLIGDIHQPLHVGTRGDKGGNDVKIDWFSEKSNLYRVWDIDMINSSRYSFTELAEIVSNVSKE
ncbi:MAG: S1/P1 nuclease [Bacteroidota bacterium]